MRAAGAFFALALGAIAPARAAIDANGRWTARAEGTSGPSVNIKCLADIAQSGTSFAVTGSCELVGNLSLAGTFDPTSGDFTATGHSQYDCSTLTIAGTVAADSASFTGRFDCGGPFPVSGTFVGSRCGNGQVDPGEECDDGNQLDGDCCSSSCTFEPAGGPCRSDGNSCTADQCDGAGMCTHFTKPDGTSCTDWDACTVGDTCQAGVCEGTPAVCGACQVCNRRLGCVSIFSPSCPPPKPVRLPVTCRDGVHGVVVEDFGAPTCEPGMCDADGKRDGVCTFRIVISQGVKVCRIHKRVIAVPVGQRRTIRGNDCRRPGRLGSPFFGIRMILHCRPHRQVPVCSLP